MLFLVNVDFMSCFAKCHISDKGTKVAVPVYLQLILGEVALNCCDIGTDIKGYHVLIHIIKHFSHGDYENIVLNEMAENALTLAYDPFGSVHILPLYMFMASS